MRIDQGDIARDVTAARNFCQRLPVTEFRHTDHMPRPIDLPAFNAIGARVRYWREKRKISRKDLAKRTKQSYSALSDLENGNSLDSERLDLLALELRLNPVYLRTDKGDPEAPAHPSGPEATPSSWLGQVHALELDEIEETYLAAQVQQALQTIENARNRKHQKRG